MSADFQLTSVVRRGRSTVLYEGVRLADGLPVLVKALSGTPSEREASRLHREYQVASGLQDAAAARVIAFQRHDPVAVVLEDVGARPLDGLLAAPLPARRFLELATPIAAAVGRLHARGLVHRDLRPEHLLVGPGDEVLISGLGSATFVLGEHPAGPPPALPAAALPFLAPELTGRLGPVVDARADLYSLGVVFYRMLTGRLPFSADDALGWLHNHLARAPIPPRDVIAGIPAVLEGLVLRLLEKLPDDRYQAAAGLVADLERCRARARSHRRLDPFVLGRRDVPDRIRMPHQLYGREEEVATLLRALEEVVARQEPGVVLIGGPAGIGKSTLARALHRPVLERSGYFLAGKFDQHRWETPYSAVRAALGELAVQLLAEQDERIAGWRSRVLEAIGPGGARVIVDTVPAFAQLLGEPQPAEELPPAAAATRLVEVLRRFIAVFARPEHPVVLLLDDLQWADPGSLRLVEAFASAAPAALLVIAAYRDEELSPTHLLAATLDRLREGPTPARELALGPLDRRELRRILMDTLHCSGREAAPLARLAAAKTGGNPFFLGQFLSALQQEGLATLDRTTGTWRWDLGRIRELRVSENLIDLMARRLARLPSSTSRTLELAAFLGSSFEVATLAALRGEPEALVRRDLGPALEEGLVLPSGAGARFVHDRVWQAAYALVPPERRAGLHLSIGEALLARTPADALGDRIFDLVGHFHLAGASVPAAERVAVARLFLLAGSRARAAAAHAAAARYHAAGAALLGDDAWGPEHDLCFALALGQAEAELLVRGFGEAERLLARLVPLARTRAERATVERLRVELHATRGESEQALAAASAGVAGYGLELPPHPSEELVRAAEEALEGKLAGRAIETFVGEPLRQDPEVEAALQLLAAVLPTAYFADPRLHRLVACHLVDLTLRHGLTPAAPVAFASYGLELVGTKARYEEAERFGQVATALVERPGFAAGRAKVANLMGAVLHHWTHPLRSCLEYDRAAVRAGLETGDFLFACYAALQVPVRRIALGDPLEEVVAEAHRAEELLRRLGYELFLPAVTLLERFARCLQGRTYVASFGGPDFDAVALERQLVEAPFPLLACWHHLHRMQARLHFGDGPGALADAERARPLLGSLRGQQAVIDFHTGHALALALTAPAAGPDRRATLVAQLRDHQRQLGEWALHCPENFACRHALVTAELARVEGRHEDAEREHERAVRTAQESGFHQLVGLAAERAAANYLARELRIPARGYLLAARDAYGRWGATGKVLQLEQLHPELREPIATDVVRPEQLDAMVIARASQAISREIALPGLVKALLRTTLQEAGAQRGWLLTLDRPGGEPLVAARATLETRDVAVELVEPPAPPAAGELPLSVVQHALRTGERVLIADAGEPHRFSGDLSLRARPVRSAICLPLVHQAAPVGVLYLENDLVPGAFTADRLSALELLAAQAAISLENARLFHVAQDAIRARDELLLVAAHELQTPITALKMQAQLVLRALGAAPEKLPELLAPLLGTFDRQLGRLSALAEVVLDVSRIQAGLLVLRREELDLAQLVRDVADRLAGPLAAAGCTLTLELPPSLRIVADGARLEQVLVNLLGNAMKFGAGKPIEVRLRGAGGPVSLVVVDHGPGVGTADRERIFRRFERATSPMSHGGLGLGLFIAREIVLAHGGVIRAEGEPSAGARFVVELPADVVRG